MTIARPVCPARAVGSQPEWRTPRGPLLHRARASAGPARLAFTLACIGPALLNSDQLPSCEVDTETISPRVMPWNPKSCFPDILRASHWDCWEWVRALPPDLYSAFPSFSGFQRRHSGHAQRDPEARGDARRRLSLLVSGSSLRCGRNDRERVVAVPRDTQQGSSGRARE